MTEWHTCQGCPGYFREPHWMSMGLPEISGVTWQLWFMDSIVCLMGSCLAKCLMPSLKARPSYFIIMSRYGKAIHYLDLFKGNIPMQVWFLVDHSFLGLRHQMRAYCNFCSLVKMFYFFSHQPLYDCSEIVLDRLVCTSNNTVRNISSDYLANFEVGHNQNRCAEHSRFRVVIFPNYSKDMLHNSPWRWDMGLLCDIIVVCIDIVEPSDMSALV